MIFSKHQGTIDYALNAASLGGGRTNQTNRHCWTDSQPVRSVRMSGMGMDNGKAGFDAQSNTKGDAHRQPGP